MTRYGATPALFFSRGSSDNARRATLGGAMSTRSRGAGIGVAPILLLALGLTIAACGTSLGPAQPAATVTVTATATPDAATSAVKTQAELAREAAVKEGIHSIQIGVESWAIDHKDVYPKPSEVNEAGMATYVETWPTNPYTGAPMAAGPEPGNYNYGVLKDRTQFALIGFGAGGAEIIMVP